jgi:hypothetical protein
VTGDVPYWNAGTTAYVPGPTFLPFTQATKPTPGSNRNRFVFISDDHSGATYFDKEDGSGYQQIGLALGGPWKNQYLRGATAGGSDTALPSTGVGQVATSLNFIQGANVTLTTGYDATNDKVDVTIAAAAGGGGGAAVLGSNMVNITTAQALTATAAQIGTAAVTFTPTSTAVLFVISLYLTTPTGSGNIALTIQQVANTGDAAQLLSPNTKATGGQVQFVGSGTSGTNAAAGGIQTTKLVGNFPNNNSMNITRFIYLTGMIVGTSYTWQPFASSAGTAAVIGQDLVTTTVMAA